VVTKVASLCIFEGSSRSGITGLRPFAGGGSSKSLEETRLVTFVPHSSEPFHSAQLCRKLSSAHMPATSVKTNRRRQDRIQAVLPVRVRGTDSTGKSFEILAHTLDLTANGARLGSIRHQLKTLDQLTIFYRQRKMEFTVVWTKLLDGRSEYQVGLQAFSQEKEGWGMNLFISSIQPLTSAAATSGTV
jgi:hypothetical protein